jgi:Mg2+ and Co2+ transporter CorA
VAALKLMEDAVAARKQAEAMAVRLAEQVDELLRWQRAMIGREDRIIAIKREVNELLAQLGQPPRYTSPGKEGSDP